MDSQEKNTLWAGEDEQAKKLWTVWCFGQKQVTVLAPTKEDALRIARDHVFVELKEELPK